jgi:ParB-like chromosome segregation protein Spo0J
MKPRSRPSRNRGRSDTREEVGNSPTAAPIRPCETFKPEQIPLEQLLEAQWNANRVPPRLLAKVRHSIEQFGVVENLVARPHPELPGKFEVLSGNHRLRVLRELGHETAPVVVVELGDAEARLLAQTLNRTRGSDDPRAYALLLEEVLARFAPAQVAEFLPETEATIDRVLREYGSEKVERLSSPVNSRSGNP